MILRPHIFSLSCLLMLQLIFACSHGDEKKEASSVPGDDQTLAPEDEYKLGRKLAAKILGAYPPIEANFNRYSTVLARYLAALSIRPTTFKGYRVQTINCPEIAAISTPGGFVFLSKPLVSAVSSEDELAGVIAHELSHIALRHGEMALRRSLEAKKDRRKTESLTGSVIDVTNSAVSLAGAGDLKRNVQFAARNKKFITGAVGELGEVAQVATYNAEQEFAADKMAVGLLLNAGYDPRKYTEFLKRNFSTMDRLKNSSKSPLRMFETHPMDETRVSRIDAMIKGWKPGPISNVREKRFERLREQILRPKEQID
jgi:predicted Zn-dependent protease